MRLLLIIISLIFLLIPKIAFAAGIVVIPDTPSLGIEKAYLSVDTYRADIDVREGIAHVSVEEVFVNPYNVQVEGTFLFPLPDNATVSSFSMMINGKSIKGEILEKDKARSMYEDIVRRLVDPALLEYIGRNTYRASIAPIKPKGRVRVHMEFVYPLPRMGNTYYVISPLSGLKYSKDPVSIITVTGRIEGKQNIIDFYSPYYNIESDIEGNEATFSFEKTHTKPDKDLTIYFTQDMKDISGALLTYEERDDEKEDGYFMFILSASKKETSLSLPKDVVIVLDKSGSMTGNKIEQAKEALTFIVKRLKKNDRLKIISFSTTVRALNSKWVRGDDKEEIGKLINKIKGINASGGTDIYSALSKALSVDMREGVAHYIIFLTDGMPTVGNTNEVEIEEMVRQNIKDKRLFVFGIGDDVNLEFLTRLFRKGRGQGEFILEKDIETAISSFYAKIESPVLSNIEITYPDIFYDIYPRDTQDLFWAQNLIILGRYEKDEIDKDNANIEITLKGDTQDGNKLYTFTFNLSPNKLNNFIPHLWASRKIGYLLEEIRLNGEKEEIVDTIISLSKRYGIVTPYTSYFVKDKEAQDILPQPGVVYSAAPMPQKRKAVAYEQTLQNAVTQAQEEDNITEETTKSIRGRLFIKKDDYWIEEGYNNEPTTSIKIASEKYFDLIKEDESLKDILSLGKVIFKYKDKWIKIVK